MKKSRKENPKEEMTDKRSLSEAKAPKEMKELRRGNEKGMRIQAETEVSAVHGETKVSPVRENSQVHAVQANSVRHVEGENRRFFSSWDWRTISAIAIGIALMVFYVNLVLFAATPQIFAALNGLAVVIALGIPVYTRYREYKRAKEIEHMFPAFMRDITENINVGMSLTQAIRTATSNDYGFLTPYVKAIAAKIDWGIPFETVLTDFSSKTKSSVIKRAVKGIIEAHSSGGTIGTVLQAMTVSVRELERIKKERATQVYSQMVTGYFIFFLFLGIMLVMAKLLIPILTFKLAGAAGTADISRVFTETFRSLVVIQGIFAGLGIGKMSEGTITAGFKHAFVLTVIGYTTFVLF